MASRKFRKLSAWNIFQRERLQKSSLDTAQYKNVIQQLSLEWNSLPHDEKEAYRVQAEYEEQQREKAMNIPLPPKSKTGDHALPNPQVSRSALKRISAIRLQKNFEQTSEHPLWLRPGQLGESDLTGLQHFAWQPLKFGPGNLNVGSVMWLASKALAATVFFTLAIFGFDNQHHTSNITNHSSIGSTLFHLV